jgi:hypothetical protein
MNKMADRETIIRNILDASAEDLDVVVNLIIDFPSTTFAEALGVADDVVGLRDKITLINPQVFSLTVDTDVADDPKRFSIELEEEGLQKSNHGYHSISFHHAGGMSARQRKTAIGIFSKLAGEQRVRQRLARLGPHQTLADADLLQLDRSALIYEDEDDRDGCTIEIVALRQRWLVQSFESELYRRILGSKTRRWRISDIRDLWCELKMDDRTSFRLRDWLEHVLRLGLVERVISEADATAQVRSIDEVMA